MKAKYATVQSFGGQRASIGRVVLVKIGVGQGDVEPVLAPGMIESIEEGDRPNIRTTTGMRFAGGMLDFAETKTEADIDSAPLGSWTWPPRA